MTGAQLTRLESLLLGCVVLRQQTGDNPEVLISFLGGGALYIKPYIERADELAAILNAIRAGRRKEERDNRSKAQRKRRTKERRERKEANAAERREILARRAARGIHDGGLLFPLDNEALITTTGREEARQGQ